MNSDLAFAFTCLLAATLLCGGCRPKHSPPAFISDGTIVLLRNGKTNAAFIVTKQSTSPETVDYTWFLRSDGKSTFGPADPSVATGRVKGARSIAFGPFDVQWSTAGWQGGYVYYPDGLRWTRAPWGEYYPVRIPGQPSMAVTTERDITKINSRDPRWAFKQ